MENKKCCLSVETKRTPDDRLFNTNEYIRPQQERYWTAAGSLGGSLDEISNIYMEV